MSLMQHHAFTPSKILVPLDFSAPSGEALQTATELACQHSAALHLLHVLPMFPVVAMVDSPISYFPEQQFLEDARKQAQGKLDACVATLSARGLVVTSGVEIGDDVVGNIMAVLGREHADLVVLSTHGTSGWRPLVFGSIAEKVIKLVSCPLLLLRAEKEPLAA